MTETEAIINQLGALPYLGIFGVALISNMVIPFPEEVVLLAFGYLAGTDKVNIWYLIPIIISGLFISDVVLYTLAKHGNRFIMIFYSKLFEKRVASKSAWVETHLEKIVFFSRFMIQLRFLGPFLAGKANMPFRRFASINLLALIIYVPLFLFLGSYFRNRIEYISSGIGVLHNVMLIGICLVVVASLLTIVYKKITKRFSQHTTK